MDKFTAESPSQQASVYRYYDGNGILLYVGVTKRGSLRNYEHASHKEWWPFVHSQQVEHFASYAAATAEEKRIIQQCRPPFNKQHNPDHKVLRQAYMLARQTPPENHEQRGISDFADGKHLKLKLQLVNGPDDNGALTLRSCVDDWKITTKIRLEHNQKPKEVRLGVNDKRVALVGSCAPYGNLMYFRAKLLEHERMPYGDWEATVYLDTSLKPPVVRIKKFRVIPQLVAS